MKIQLDMYQTIAVAVVVLMLGKFLKERVELLERFCIPAPVIGGVIFAIFTCLCYVTGIAEFSFDDILKEVCMVFYFLQFLRASVMPPGLQNLNLTIF